MKRCAHCDAGPIANCWYYGGEIPRSQCPFKAKNEKSELARKIATAMEDQIDQTLVHGFGGRKAGMTAQTTAAATAPITATQMMIQIEEARQKLLRCRVPEIRATLQGEAILKNHPAFVNEGTRVQSYVPWRDMTIIPVHSLLLGAVIETREFDEAGEIDKIISIGGPAGSFGMSRNRTHPAIWDGIIQGLKANDLREQARRNEETCDGHPGPAD